MQPLSNSCHGYRDGRELPIELWLSAERPP